MKDPCGYNSDHEWYIDPDTLTNRDKIELRKVHAEKLGKIKVACLAILGPVITGFLIRHIEYKYNEHFFKVNPEVLVKMQLQIDNIEHSMVKLVDHQRTEYNVQYQTYHWVSDLHEERYPDQHRNEFGHLRAILKEQSGE